MIHVHDFTRRVLLFALVPLALLFLFEEIVTRGLKRCDGTELKEWNAVLAGRIDADLLILGSSRAWVHVSPAVLDSVLPTKSYNLGMDGCRLPAQLCRYELYRKHHPPPKVLLQVVDCHSLENERTLYMKGQFDPYVDEEAVARLLAEYGVLPWYDARLPFLRYFGSERFVAMGFLETFRIHHFDNGKIRGYRGQDYEWDDWHARFPALWPNPDRPIARGIESEMIARLRGFLRRLHEENCQPFLVYAPEHESTRRYVSNRKEVRSALGRIAAETKTSFLDYSDHPMSRDRSLFYNCQHLNRRGAEGFSSLLARDLAPRLRPSPPEGSP